MVVGLQLFQPAGELHSQQIVHHADDDLRNLPQKELLFDKALKNI